MVAYFNETSHSYSLAEPHDTDDLTLRRSVSQRSRSVSDGRRDLYCKFDSCWTTGLIWITTYADIAGPETDF